MNRLGGRTWSAVVLAAAFGVAAGFLKGDEIGLRGQLGNLSAPWLLVALLSALHCTTLLRGALAGLAATLTALAGFYAALTVVLAGQLGGGGFLAELLVEVQSNRVYFVAGLVTGPLLGAAGAWLGKRFPASVWVVVGTLVAAEAPVVALVAGRQLSPPPLYFAWGVADWTPYIVEAVLGSAIAVAGGWWKLSARSRRTA